MTARPVTKSQPTPTVPGLFAAAEPRCPAEKIPVSVFSSSATASAAVAAEIAAIIRERAAQGRQAVLGLATGSTPQGVYDELVRMHKRDGLSFRNVVTFNLDEYWPMPPAALQSYRRFMQEHLFDHVDIDPANAHVPDGTIPQERIAQYCEDYERAIARHGGIDLQLLGIGRTGHIGFNEPGSPRDSRTRLITLDKVTRMDASSDFFGERHVPRRAITMGVGSILDARRIVIMAFGEHKAQIVRRAVQGEVTHTVSASYLQQHGSGGGGGGGRGGGGGGVRFVLDPAAAAELTRFKTPWLLGTVEQFGLKWDERLTRRAVIWLSRELGKPILKLVDEDYNEHGLQELLAARGGAYDINREVFRALSRTITGWPGGKPESSTSVLPVVGEEHGRGGRATEQAHGRDAHATFPKRVVVFSPHPDDDVISMGGTLIRLCDQGHEVHVAYQTSGNIAVWDEAAVRQVDFVREFAAAFPQLGREFAEKLESGIEAFLSRKSPGEPDTPELQRVKGLIRRTEARAAAKYSGVRPERIHFLDLPFYETGRVKKKPIGEEDVRITMELLERVRPHQVYAAGDLSDPHGTHRVCLAAIIEAVNRLATRDWMRDCVLWLYRGAWQEWGPEDIEMAVPLSPDEVRRKRIAIFKHESQKDYALFPGPNDPREFWQRAEDRNRASAALFDKLGLAEYEAIEGFVRWKPGMA
ncbi:MAG: glucosamine-6-phosphate deaminase [Phycisphaeraceae bacterium]|nr:glucosamine-6-phosphate deaminase [Phycisphaeraceae bacterium]